MRAAPKTTLANKQIASINATITANKVRANELLKIEGCGGPAANAEAVANTVQASIAAPFSHMDLAENFITKSLLLLFFIAIQRDVAKLINHFFICTKCPQRHHYKKCKEDEKRSHSVNINACYIF